MSARQPSRRTLFLTSSYPRFAGDFSGHFVRSHARAECADERTVRVLAFGDAPAGQGPPRVQLDPGIEVAWLGGGALFGAPGVLPRLGQRRTRLALLLRPLLRALSALRGRARYDRVVAHFLLLTGWPLGVWFSRRSRRAKAASLEVVAHGSDVRLYEKLPGWLRRRIAGDFMAQGAELCFVSEELRERMAAAAGSPELSRYVAAQGIVALPLDLPALPSQAEARRRLSIALDETVVVVVGRLTRGKRVDVALAAAALLPRARIVVVGDGPEARCLGQLHPLVTFVGEAERPVALAWIRAADLLLSASRLEGAPTAIREARCLGVPVVATAAGDLAKWAQQDLDLWVVD
jgi:teichuronic acid biosynthesis glycosyltransferase TuaC